MVTGIPQCCDAADAFKLCQRRDLGLAQALHLWPCVRVFLPPTNWKKVGSSSCCCHPSIPSIFSVSYWCTCNYWGEEVWPWMTPFRSQKTQLPGSFFCPVSILLWNNHTVFCCTSRTLWGSLYLPVATMSGTWWALADKVLDVMESSCQSCFDFDPYGCRVLSIPVPMLELMIRGKQF